jgi:anti-sigma-K factor RskA
MSTYLWWAANQTLRLGGGLFATHPVETSLAMAALANPGTRGFAWRVIKGAAWNTGRYMWANLLTVGRAAAAESKFASKAGSIAQTLGRWATRNPLAVIVVADIAAVTTAVKLSQNEDPLTESLQVRSVSHGVGGTGQPSIGTGGDWLIGGGGFSF